jgi:hypothetical protein
MYWDVLFVHILYTHTLTFSVGPMYINSNGMRCIICTHFVHTHTHIWCGTNVYGMSPTCMGLTPNVSVCTKKYVQKSFADGIRSKAGSH